MEDVRTETVADEAAIHNSTPVSHDKIKGGEVQNYDNGNSNVVEAKDMSGEVVHARKKRLIEISIVGSPSESEQSKTRRCDAGAGESNVNELKEKKVKEAKPTSS